MQKATFTAPVPLFQPKGVNPFLTLAVSSDGNNITVTATEIIGKQNRTRTFPVTAEDDETMIVPDDLHRSTINMLVGIGQRMMYLKRHGFEREP